MPGEIVLGSSNMMPGQNQSTENNTSLKTDAILITKEELWFQLIFTKLLIGGSSAVLHCLIAIAIYRVESLRTRFFVFMFYMSAARSIYGLGNAIVGVYRILRTVGVASVDLPSFTCQMVHFLVRGPQTYDFLMLLIMIIDMTISLAYPLLYRNMSSKQAVKISSFAAVLIFSCCTMPSFTGVSFTNIIQCINLYSSTTPEYDTYMRYLEFTLSVGILIAFIALWIVFRHRLTHGGLSTNQATSKRSMKILRFIRVQLIIHCSLVITSRSLQLATQFMPIQGRTEQRVQVYNAIIGSMYLLANAIIFYWRHPKLCYASLKMICGHAVAKRLSKWEETTDELGATKIPTIENKRQTTVHAPQVYPL